MSHVFAHSFKFSIPFNTERQKKGIMTIKISPPITRESIFLPAKIIYYSSRLYPVYPFTIIGNIQDGATRVQILDRFIGLYNLLLAGVVIWINVNYDLQGLVSTSRVIEGANKLSLFTEIIFTMLLHVINFHMKDRVWKIFHKMDKFDKQVSDCPWLRMVWTLIFSQFRKLYMHHYNEKEFRFILCFVVIFFVTLNLSIWTDFYMVSSEFGVKLALLKVVYYFAILGPHWAFMYSYIIILYLIWHRFKNLANNLK